MENQRDEQIWKIAEARTSFKSHLVCYVAVNIFLIGVWYFSGGREGKHFWPVWTLLGWGIGLAMHYMGAYRSDNYFSTEKEYEKMMRERQGN